MCCSYLDMATAVSGSGPAYYYMVMEAMVDSAVHMGFSRDIARELVLQTMKVGLHCFIFIDLQQHRNVPFGSLVSRLKAHSTFCPSYCRVQGSVEYVASTGEHPAQLRNDITSPGGTTAAALYEMERGNFRTVVADSVWAAYRRSLEMGGKNSQVGPGRSQ